ncbi:acyl-CoA synthetase [Streptomyces sp. SCSIO ZS0520]|uniref:acyl-CoA synthetase n=1 Tax=Streptomyces sp. SCSIO ZS0520 TaxID=2892996 RepID=UPI0021D94114|nr:AMP-binding protein [Streptomyces sp. SCSIO ZS0520]
MSAADHNAVRWYLDRHLDGPGADAPCLLSEQEEFSYRALHALVCRTARVLTDGGVAPGDRLVVVLPDCVTSVAAILAAMRIGAVPVPMSPLLTLDEQCYVIEDSGARAVLLDEARGALAAEAASRFPGAALWSRTGGTPAVPALPELAAQAEELREITPRTAQDPALMQYTSGSTGRPKGVVHLHGALLALPEGLARHLRLTAADRILSTAKLPFGYGFGNSVLLPLSAGASAVLHPGRTDPFTVSGLLTRFRPSLLFSVPTLYAALLALPDAADRLQLSSVRIAVSSGEHLGEALGTRLTEELGLPLMNALGSTECLHSFLATAPGAYRPGASGAPVPGFRAEILDEDERPVPPGESGRLRVRGPGVATRYWNRPERTAETFRDGWVYTEDVMRRDPDGSWHHLGRTDSVLNVGGMKIITTEIEEILLKVPGVRACAVVGVPDAHELTRIAAYVVADSPEDELALPERVFAAARAGLPAFKRPGTVRTVPELPTTSTGKTSRHLIRQTESERLR